MGHLDEARQHCDSAEEVLKLAPNAWILGNSLLTRGTLATLARELNRALEYVAAAKSALASSGQSRAMVACDASMAHLLLLTGQFEKAQLSLSKLIEDRRTPRSALIGLCESLARTCLAQGRLDQCRSALDRADLEAERSPMAAAYDVRWAAITRARLLMKEAKFAESAAWLNNPRLKARDSTVD
jgi:tetratricopeptide (TPR) repeat protein